MPRFTAAIASFRTQPDVCDAALTQTIYTPSSTRESTDVLCGWCTPTPPLWKVDQQRRRRIQRVLASSFFLSLMCKDKEAQDAENKIAGKRLWKGKNLLTSTRPVLLIASGSCLGFKTLKNIFQSSGVSQPPHLYKRLNVVSLYLPKTSWEALNVSVLTLTAMATGM